MKILWADDELDFLRHQMQIVSGWGHELETAEDGLTALRLLEGGSFDVAILDIQMPQLTGLEVVTRARAMSLGTDFVIFSAKSTVQNAIQALRNGVFDFLIKPVRMEELRDVLGRIEEKRKAGGPSRPHVLESASPPYEVFLSYRRKGGAEAVRALRSELVRRDLAVFLDVVDLGGSYFDDELLERISATPNFVVVLTPECLTRRNHDVDWFYWEIEHALKADRNIIPVLKDDFTFPDDATMAREILDLKRRNAVSYSHDYFDAMIDRIVTLLA